MPFFFQPLARKGSRILLLTQLIGKRTSCRAIQGNRAVNFKSRSADLKSLTPLLPELYSTQSYYHYYYHDDDDDDDDDDYYYY